MEPKVIAERAAKLGFPAVALNDRNGLYAAMAFTEACIAKGVQPIVGAMLAVARPPETGSDGVDWLVLLAKDEKGYGNLCHLVSSAHLDRPIELDPHVPFAALDKANEGLIALTAGSEGALARLLSDGQKDQAGIYLDRLQALFPDRLYIEIIRRNDPVEEASEEALVELALQRNLPLVATNPAAYSDPSFHAAHDAMLCIAQSTYIESNDRQTSSPQSWLKDSAAIAELFVDLPEALANTAVIARRCAVGAPKRRPILPRLSDQEDEQLRADAHAGLDLRLAGRSDEDKAPYRERLDFEIDVITRMGFAGYFLIVADFIKWAKAHDIPVGPGRGSGAGSVVAWALTITDLDPLALNLLFERFLNPERVSMPDFDIDFCETRRDEVISYVQQKYGRDKVAQIITFGRLKARAVLKDTGRVLQMSYGHVDRLAKMIPNHPTDPWTLERSLNGVSELAAEYKADSDVKRLIDLAMKLEGLPRHASTHAAGVVIGDRRLDDLVPMYRDPRSDMPVTQFDMKYVEAAGLVKFDFLGLKTLSVLKEAERLLADQGVDVDFTKLTWDDPEVYELLQRGDTVGVFQLESEGMRRTLAAVRPTGFGDIIALVSLYRPGPMDNIPMFGDRKNGRAELAYPHPMLEEVLKETYGIFVYQEQVMQAAQVLAGYSLGEADLLRRAMGKKIQSEMDAQRARFVQGCAAHDISPAKASELFDLIDKFAGYGFNKSHAAAYALVAYHTGWLKAHHRPEFYAASMSFDMTQTDKLSLFVEDMRRGEIECLPPCVNASQAAFSVEDGKVRYALGALKGVGEKAMEALVAEREAKGPFKSLDDFAERIDPRLLNRRQIESLAAAGAFDAISPDRAAVYASAETILAHASSAAEQRTSGQHALVRRQRGIGRTDPPEQDGAMVAGPAHDRRTRFVRLLFLGTPRRLAPAFAGGQQGQDVRPTGGVADAGGGPGRGHYGGTGRGSALANVGQGQALSAGDAQRFLRPIPGQRLRRRGERGGRGGGQGADLRPPDRGARQASGRRTAARRDQALPAAGDFGQAHPAPDGDTRVFAFARSCDRSRAVEFTRRRRDRSPCPSAIDGRRGGRHGGARLHARRGARGPHRADHRRGERRPLRPGAAEARPRRLRLRPSRSRRRLPSR